LTVSQIFFKAILDFTHQCCYIATHLPQKKKVELGMVKYLTLYKNCRLNKIEQRRTIKHFFVYRVIQYKVESNLWKKLLWQSLASESGVHKGMHDQGT